VRARSLATARGRLQHWRPPCRVVGGGGSRLSGNHKAPAQGEEGQAGDQAEGAEGAAAATAATTAAS
jgi:hypothetical protein